MRAYSHFYESTLCMFMMQIQLKSINPTQKIFKNNTKNETDETNTWLDLMYLFKGELTELVGVTLANFFTFWGYTQPLIWSVQMENGCGYKQPCACM